MNLPHLCAVLFSFELTFTQCHAFSTDGEQFSSSKFAFLPANSKLWVSLFQIPTQGRVSHWAWRKPHFLYFSGRRLENLSSGIQTGPHGCLICAAVVTFLRKALIFYTSYKRQMVYILKKHGLAVWNLSTIGVLHLIQYQKLCENLQGLMFQHYSVSVRLCSQPCPTHGRKVENEEQLVLCSRTP